jgi:photosystem II stability/assembly factor-like uncharacterized protein
LTGAICLMVLAVGSAPGARPPHPPDSSGVLGRLPGASITSIAQDASGNVFVAGTTPPRSVEPILRTTDLGATWTPLALPLGVTSFTLSPVDAEVMFSFGESGIYKSVDTGRTWRKVSNRGALFLAVDPSDPKRVMATYQYRLMRSFDGGETWSERNTGVAPAGSIYPDPSGSGIVIVRFENKTVDLSRDWGETFEYLPVPMQWAVGAVAFDPAHRGWIYATSIGFVDLGGLYLSTDFGRTWTEKMARYNLGGLQIDPAGTLYAIGQDIQRSTDQGVTWTRYGEGRTQAVQGIGCARSTLFGRSSGVSFSFDWGATWLPSQYRDVQAVAAGAGCSFYLVRQPASEGFLAKMGPDGVVRWREYLGSPDPDTPSGVVVDGAGSAYVAAGGGGGASLWKFTPDGRVEYRLTIGSWTTMTDLAFDSASNLYAAGQKLFVGVLAKVSPAGVLLASTDLPAYPTGVVVDPDDRPIVAYSTGQVMRLVRWNPTLSVALDSFDTTFPTAVGPAIDSQGNLVLAGGRSAGTGSAPGCGVPMVLTVTKLRSRDWSTVYSKATVSSCGIYPESVTVDSAGAPTVSMREMPGLPTARPGFGSGRCLPLSGAVVKLTPDASRVAFGSYFDSCTAPAIAPAGTGLIVGAEDRLFRIAAPENYAN